MKNLTLAIIVTLLTSNAFAEDVPPKIQKKILAGAPEIDLNKDGTVTAEELKVGREKLPAETRAMLDAYLGTQKAGADEAATAKYKSTLPKPPEGNGATPFINKLFEYKETENITYGTAQSGDTTMPLMLDVYRPVSTAQLPNKLPAMILAFWGGWTKGSKDVKYIRDLCAFYAERGYVAISIQYRIAKDNAPAVPGPLPNPEGNDQYRLMNAAFQDTCNAVRWVRAHADEYQIDPSRICIGGVSAGAFNALYTGFCDSKITGADAQVAAVISLMGSLSPNHINKDDPPVFIAHGTSDNVVPYSMVTSMVQQLEQVNAIYSFYPVAGVAHRLEEILDTKFDGKTVKDHSLDFCFAAMKLGELIK